MRFLLIQLSVFLPLFSEVYRGETVSERLSSAHYAPQEGICRIFLIRHGETDWNAQGLSQGWADIPLNEEGEAQARRLAENFSDLSIAAIYSSVLGRAMATSRLLAAFHPGAAIIYDPSLRFYDPDKRREASPEAETRIAQEIAEAARAAFG